MFNKALFWIFVWFLKTYNKESFLNIVGLKSQIFIEKQDFCALQKRFHPFPFLKYHVGA